MNDLVVRKEYNEYPGIIQYAENENSTIYSPNTYEQISFYQTRETLLDVEIYKAFLDNAIARFRRSRAYKSYKSYLMSLGLNKCQIMGYIEEDMASIEMHHNFLTIHDIALMITEHVINTVGIISTFDLVQLLILEHQNNNIPIVMLSKTAHQMYHNAPENFISPQMTFGRWWNLLYKYKYGVTINIARKVIMFINNFEKDPDGNTDGLLVKIRNDILSFSQYNEYGCPKEQCGYINGNMQNGFYYSPGQNQQVNQYQQY